MSSHQACNLLILDGDVVFFDLNLKRVRNKGVILLGGFGEGGISYGMFDGCLCLRQFHSSCLFAWSTIFSFLATFLVTC